MALLGDTIDPRLMVNDYSGFARAGATQGQMYAQMGKDVGGLARTYGDYKKKQGEDERFVEKSKSVAKAIGDMIPELRPTLDESLRTLGDKEIPLSRRKATADGVADILGIAVGEVRNRQNLSLKEREFGLQERELENRQYETFLRNQPKINRQRVMMQRVINNESFDVPIYVDPDNPRDALYEDGSPVYDGAPTDVGKTEMPGGGSYPNYGGWSTATTLNNSALPDGEVLPTLINLDEESSASNAEAIDAAAKLTGGQTDVPNGSPMPPGTPTTTQMPKVDGPPIPPGAVPSKKDSYRPATLEEATPYGAEFGQINERTGQFTPTKQDPERRSVWNFETNSLEVTEGPAARKVTAAAEKAASAEQAKITKASGIRQDLNWLEDRSDSMTPGVAGAVGRMFAERIPASEQAKNKAVIDRLRATLTVASLTEMRQLSPTGAALGNVSNTDVLLMTNTATSLANAQSPEEFKRELIRLKNLEHDVIYGSEQVLKDKLSKGKINKSQFDAAMAAAPPQYLNDRGVITTRKFAPASGANAGESKSIYDEFLPK